MDSSETTITCIAKAPALCTTEERQEFFDLVASAGKVATRHLAAGMGRARSLAFLRQGNHLVGTAGLKCPSDTYRAKVSKNADFALPISTYEFELGWVSVLPGSDGGKSYAMSQSLLSVAPHAGVFATTATTNGAMQTTLGKLGFRHAGREWRSSEAEEMLCLFVKAQVKP